MNQHRIVNLQACTCKLPSSSCLRQDLGQLYRYSGFYPSDYGHCNSTSSNFRITNNLQGGISFPSQLDLLSFMYTNDMSCTCVPSQCPGPVQHTFLREPWHTGSYAMLQSCGHTLKSMNGSSLQNCSSMQPGQIMHSVSGHERQRGNRFTMQHGIEHGMSHNNEQSMPLGAKRAVLQGLQYAGPESVENTVHLKNGRAVQYAIPKDTENTTNRRNGYTIQQVRSLNAKHATHLMNGSTVQHVVPQSVEEVAHLRNGHVIRQDFEQAPPLPTELVQQHPHLPESCTCVPMGWCQLTPARNGQQLPNSMLQLSGVSRVQAMDIDHLQNSETPISKVHRIKCTSAEKMVFPHIGEVPNCEPRSVLKDILAETSCKKECQTEYSILGDVIKLHHTEESSDNYRYTEREAELKTEILRQRLKLKLYETMLKRVHNSYESLRSSSRIELEDYKMRVEQMEKCLQRCLSCQHCCSGNHLNGGASFSHFNSGASVNHLNCSGVKLNDLHNDANENHHSNNAANLNHLNSIDENPFSSDGANLNRYSNSGSRLTSLGSSGANHFSSSYANLNHANGYPATDRIIKNDSMFNSLNGYHLINGTLKGNTSSMDTISSSAKLGALNSDHSISHAVNGDAKLDKTSKEKFRGPAANFHGTCDKDSNINFRKLDDGHIVELEANLNEQSKNSSRHSSSRLNNSNNIKSTFNGSSKTCRVNSIINNINTSKSSVNNNVSGCTDISKYDDINKGSNNMNSSRNEITELGGKNFDNSRCGSLHSLNDKLDFVSLGWHDLGSLDSVQMEDGRKVVEADVVINEDVGESCVEDELDQPLPQIYLSPIVGSDSDSESERGSVTDYSDRWASTEDNLSNVNQSVNRPSNSRESISTSRESSSTNLNNISISRENLMTGDNLFTSRENRSDNRESSGENLNTPTNRNVKKSTARESVSVSGETSNTQMTTLQINGEATVTRKLLCQSEQPMVNRKVLENGRDQLEWIGERAPMASSSRRNEVRRSCSDLMISPRVEAVDAFEEAMTIERLRNELAGKDSSLKKLRAALKEMSSSHGELLEKNFLLQDNLKVFKTPSHTHNGSYSSSGCSSSSGTWRRSARKSANCKDVINQSDSKGTTVATRQLSLQLGIEGFCEGTEREILRGSGEFSDISPTSTDSICFTTMRSDSEGMNGLNSSKSSSESDSGYIHSWQQQQLQDMQDKLKLQQQLLLEQKQLLHQPMQRQNNPIRRGPSSACRSLGSLLASLPASS